MIRWMAEHKVAANLLMLILLFWGGMSTLNIKQELFPAFELDLLVVAVPYSGATPEEVEESIIVPIESEINSFFMPFTSILFNLNRILKSHCPKKDVRVILIFLFTLYHSYLIYILQLIAYFLCL